MAFRKPHNVPPKTLFGVELQRLMEEHNMTLRDLSEKVGGTYEYARLLARGQNLPSPYYVRSVAAALGVDIAHLEGLVKQDRFNRDFGDMVRQNEAPAGTLPQLEEPVLQFHRAWPLLDQTQKSTLLQMLKMFVAAQTVAAGGGSAR